MQDIALSFQINVKMKPVKYYVVDAFAEAAFKGNPAAVCLLEEDRDDQWLQALASEFYLPVTCYLTRITDTPNNAASCRFRLRWFSPVNEVSSFKYIRICCWNEGSTTYIINVLASKLTCIKLETVYPLQVKLCGHATLAAAHTLFKSGLINSRIIEILTFSGTLIAKKVTDPAKPANGEAQVDSYFIELNLPADPSSEIISVDASLISEALGGASAIDLRRTTIMDNLLVVLPSGTTVADLKINFDAIEKCPGSMGVIVTGIAPPESGYDFYSRFFCPKFGVNEDHVCGSAHCALATYWYKKTGKTDLVAYQASPRGGILNIHLDEQNHRVMLRGKAVTVMEGAVLV